MSISSSGVLMSSSSALPLEWPFVVAVVPFVVLWEDGSSRVRLRAAIFRLPSLSRTVSREEKVVSPDWVARRRVGRVMVSRARAWRAEVCHLDVLSIEMYEGRCGDVVSGM